MMRWLVLFFALALSACGGDQRVSATVVEVDRTIGLCVDGKG
jgi:uncharacterized lipoprotein YmbA